ncbi:hypothetical protein DTL42_19955 [Bremerella cremea]|uniref:Uncharacterized protein n=1 Tax=Bremerella cremea TaxID=1031537 RepID=A0A368KLK9_9BACT|nr:hypothetical protein [Bremerella cremea]RCS42106.1 hypothetical protein DTL42_19955 [Bremerella cremea]
MATLPEDTDLKVTMNPIIPWLVILSGASWFVLGILITTPLSALQAVFGGLFLAGSGVIVFAGGWFWWKHLPVVLRMTSAGLEVPRLKSTYQWEDIEEVAVQRIFVPKELKCLCVRIKLESRDKYGLPDPQQSKDVFQKMLSNFADTYDFRLSQQELLIDVECLKTEIERRIALASSRPPKAWLN